MTPQESDADTGYKKFRGRCKELSEAECAKDPSLTLIRGHYYCPIWNTEEPHWWCVRQDGTILDPSKDQFPSRGIGAYVPFDGFVDCDNCGKVMLEKDAMFESNYAFCSSKCFGQFVGVC